MADTLQKIVLLADDESSVRAYAKAVLQQEGDQVLEAADGLDALALFRKLGGAIDILVTDIKMPRMDGIELARSIRMECPNIPVIYVSGEPFQNELHDPKGGMIFVSKPFLPQLILKAVRELLPRIARPTKQIPIQMIGGGFILGSRFVITHSSSPIRAVGPNRLRKGEGADSTPVVRRCLAGRSR